MKQSNKLVIFLKRNAYYIVMAVCVLAIITMVTVALVLTFSDNSTPTVDAGGNLVAEPTDEPISDIVDTPIVDTPITDTPIVDVPVVDTPIVDPTPDIPTIDTDVQPEPVLPEKTYTAPIDNYTVIKSYSAKPVYSTSLKRYVSHLGVDLVGTNGATVMASMAGTVESVTYDILYGHQIVILHDNDVRTIYKSVDNVTVTAGDAVTMGQAIATVSTSAGSESADGAHLHYEITVNGTNVNPMEYQKELL